MKPTTSRRTDPKSRPSVSFPAHIADELRRYDEHLRDVRGLSPGTRKDRIHVAGMLLRQKFNGCAIDMSRLRAGDIRQFLAKQLEANRSASNASHFVGALRSYPKSSGSKSATWCSTPVPPVSICTARVASSVACRCGGHHYVEADLSMKERALAKLHEPDAKIQRYRASDALLDFLKTL